MRAKAKICLILHKLPSEVKDLSFEEAAFLSTLYDEEKEKDRKSLLDSLGYMLGTSWEVDEPPKETIKVISKVKQDKITFPLVYAIGLAGMNGTKDILKAIDSLREKAKRNFPSEHKESSMSKKDYLNIFKKEA